MYDQLSIVIPVYNCEKYISRCLESVVKFHPDSQIIIVNDGSTDNTKNICDKFKSENKNICLINLHKNSGVSNARNVGIKYATNEFLTFIDGDDYLVGNISKEIDKSFELVIFGRIYDYNNNIVNCNMPYLGEIKKDCLINNHLATFLNVQTSIWVTNKIYKTQIIKKHKIHFKKWLNFGEDLNFNLKYFKHIENILFVNSHLTVYNRNVDNSLSRKYEIQNISQVLEQRKHLKKFLNKHNRNQYAFFLDTKNILMYATKKVISANGSRQQKIEQLNKLKSIDKNIIACLNINDALEKKVFDFVTNANQNLLEKI